MLQFYIRYTIALACLLLFSIPARAAAPSSARPPNIILLVVDDLRADQLGPYGDKRRATPRFDALARESVVFERAFSQAGWTLPSVSSIMTGLYPTTHGVRRSLPEDWPMRREAGGLVLKPGNSLPRDRTTIAGALRRRGYRTEAITSCPFCDPPFGFSNGFDAYTAGGSFVDVDAVLERWLPRLLMSAPFFLYVHVNDAHMDTENSKTAPEDLKRYDAQIASVDAGLGALLELLSAKGLLDSTILAVTADHGEEFGEHGRRGHGASPYETALRVPLIIRLPGGKNARRVADLAQTIDLFPTFLDLAGLPPQPGLQGASLKPEIEGSTAPVRAVYSEIYPHEPGDSDVLTAVAVRTPDWKYIWRPDGKDELYWIRSDPGELRDLAASRADVVKGFRARTTEWRKGLRRAAARISPPAAATAELPPAEAERLRRAGYLK